MCGIKLAIYFFVLISFSNGIIGTESLFVIAFSKYMSLKINFDNVDFFVFLGMENIMYFKVC